jgi:prepilin-type N-terminal cleavage/methylation domain-containing protein
MRRLRSQAGFTLIELLVSMTMGVVVLGAVGSLVVSAMRNQPQISERAQDITTARWVLERLTREIRNGIRVDKATASSVSFETYVRHATCGGKTFLAASSASIKCEVTYTCTTTYCSRIEAAPGVYTGKATRIFEGIDSNNVFAYTPNAEDATFIEVTLHMPNPAGHAPLTVSDGASLRNATLTY